MGRKRRGDAVDGVLLLDKPGGLTSNLALQKARRLLERRQGRPRRHARSARHRPAALARSARRPSSRPTCSTRTRAIEAMVRLGVRTTTDDADGAVIAHSAGRRAADAQVVAALCTLRRPHHAGAADVLGAQARRQAAVRLCARRRRGRARAARGDHCTASSLLEFDGPGTHASTDRLQQGHLRAHAGRRPRRRARLRRAPRALRRTRVGGWRSNAASTLEALEAMRARGAARSAAAGGCAAAGPGAHRPRRAAGGALRARQRPRRSASPTTAGRAASASTVPSADLLGIAELNRRWVCLQPRRLS